VYLWVEWAISRKHDGSLTDSETGESSSKSARVRCVYCIFTVFLGLKSAP